MPPRTINSWKYALEIIRVPLFTSMCVIKRPYISDYLHICVSKRLNTKQTNISVILAKRPTHRPTHTSAFPFTRLCLLFTRVYVTDCRRDCSLRSIHLPKVKYLTLRCKKTIFSEVTKAWKDELAHLMFHSRKFTCGRTWKLRRSKGGHHLCLHISLMASLRNPRDHHPFLGLGQHTKHNIRRKIKVR